MLGLVGDYGSDSENENVSDNDESGDTDARVTLIAPSDPAPAPPSAVTSDAVTKDLLAKLPAPKKKKRVVKLKTSLDYAALLKHDSDEEDQPKEKKFKPTTGSSLKDFLPKPKNEEEDDLGGALGFGASSRSALKLDAAPKVPAEETRSSGTGAASAAPLVPMSHQLHSAEPEQVYQPQTYSVRSQPTAAAQAAPSGLDEQADDLFEKAMQMEVERRNRKGSKGDPFAKKIVPTFKEINQASLTHLHKPAETMLETGKAFGPQYQQELMKQAGPKPDKLAKRKHQIGSLYYEAKAKELEMMESKSKGMKSKAQTHGKYGWI